MRRTDLHRQLVATAALLAAGLVFAGPAAAERRLAWRPLAVEARLDAGGRLWLRESHTMVFTGDWNGGERIFDLRPGQSLELLSLTRLDPSGGAAVPLEEGSLSRVDHYDWVDRGTLRWRSRLPTDPPFDETAITYVLEYRQEGVVRRVGEDYRLEHDFAFPGRVWPIEGFTLELELDPIWRPLGSLAARHGPLDLAPGLGHLVTVDLDYTGEGSPAAVHGPPPVAPRAAIFGAAVLAILALVGRFCHREASLGRFSPPAVPAGIDTGWLAEHLFDLLPEEAGALWDRKVGPPEVAAILSRWQTEGRIESRVEAAQGWFARDVLRLELTADRESFAGYEERLLDKLFFDRRQETDTKAIRERYRKSGFDPAAIVRAGILRRLRERGGELEEQKKRRRRGRGVTLLLFGAALALLAVEAAGQSLLTFQLAMLVMVPLAVLYLLFGMAFARAYANRVDRLAWWSLGFGVPALLFTLTMITAAFFDRLLPGIDFALQPGLAGTVALAALSVMVWSSLLNQAACRERPAALERRQRLAAVRRLFARELRSQAPALLDDWMPYLLALGLGPKVDRWWRHFGGAEAADAATLSRPAGAGASGAGASGPGSSWTGGGGAFGGAGATASWAAVAGGMATGVAKPSSGGSGGGGGSSGGGFSGGGGGGGW